MKKITSPRLRELAGSSFVGVEVDHPDDAPFTVRVTAVVALVSGELWRPTRSDMSDTLRAVEREDRRGEPWAPAILDLVASHVLTMDEMLRHDPIKTLYEELTARAGLRELARELREHFQDHRTLPLGEVLQIVDVERIYHEAIVDDVHNM